MSGSSLLNYNVKSNELNQNVQSNEQSIKIKISQISQQIQNSRKQKVLDFNYNINGYPQLVQSEIIMHKLMNQTQSIFHKKDNKVYQAVYDRTNNQKQAKQRQTKLNIGLYEFKTKPSSRIRLAYHHNNETNQLINFSITPEKDNLSEIVNNSNFLIQFENMRKQNNRMSNKINQLSDERNQLISKINWLNSIIEDMMTLNHEKSMKNLHQISKINNQEIQYITDNLNKNKQVLKKEQQLQTSFIQQTNNQVNEFIALYQRSLLERNKLVGEIAEVTQLQNLYAQQFQLIINEIKELKMKQETIKHMRKRDQNQQQTARNKLTSYRSKDKSNAKSKINPNRKYSFSSQYEQSCLNLNLKKQSRRNESGKRIFQNSIIYQLKKENDDLHKKYHTLRVLHQDNMSRGRRYEFNKMDEQVGVEMNQDSSRHDQSEKTLRLSQEKYYNHFYQNHDKKLNYINYQITSNINNKHKHATDDISQLLYRQGVSDESSAEGSIRSYSSQHSFIEKRHAPSRYQKQQNTINLKLEHQQSAPSYNRYKNFIKCLKQKFGITSQILSQGHIQNY